MSRNVMYKPPVDLEQVPLINPNSPSHLKSSSDTQMPYPPQLNQQHKADYDVIENPCKLILFCNVIHYLTVKCVKLPAFCVIV